MSGFDTDASRFGQMLCRRLGYMQVTAEAWCGNEADGMSRTVRLVVKCPPKPMLPDQVRPNSPGGQASLHADSPHLNSSDASSHQLISPRLSPLRHASPRPSLGNACPALC